MLRRVLVTVRNYECLSTDTPKTYISSNTYVIISNLVKVKLSPHMPGRHIEGSTAQFMLKAPFHKRFLAALPQMYLFKWTLFP